MTELTATQQSFINKLKENEELQWKGFQLVLQRSDFARFFDLFENAGFFSPAQNPAPVPGDRENTIRIPFWAPLHYLKAAAKNAGQENDLVLATKVMTVVRNVSTWRDEKGEARNNYHTSGTFTEILGLVPTPAVSMGDIDLIAGWLSDPYDRMLVTGAIDKDALPHFLDSAHAEDREKAARVLHHVTAITWRGKGNESEPEPLSVADDFWLGELLKHHAKESGRKIGGAAADVLLARVREVFSTPTRHDYSSIFRPAIGDDVQNYQFRSAENRAVEGLRDVLLGWSEQDPSAARIVVKQMVQDDLQIVRRVGLHVLAQRWVTMSGLYHEIVTPELFNEHTHELYHLLKDRFAEMDTEDHVRTLDAIEALPKCGGDDREDLRRFAQFRWLSAIAGKGFAPADRLFAEISADPKVGKLGEHPDFDSYITGWVGPGPSPYSPQELTALTQAGAVAEKLGAFSPGADWFGPTSNGLSSALESAARTQPDVFLSNLGQFLSAEPIHQHAVLSGLKRAWESKTNANWGQGWEHLVVFFEQLSGDERFWQRTDDHRPWVVTAIADFLAAGSKEDEHAYDPQLLPRAGVIITRLLEHERGTISAADDAMTQALNTTKGRTIEALYSHALRAARVSDREKHVHTGAWHTISATFEAELRKCTNANFEFSTFAGAYLPQLQYLDGDWTKHWVQHIFPALYEANTLCAVDGLSYAAFTRPTYELLAQSGVIDRALGLELKGRATRGKLIERIGAAYLWGIERLDGERLTRVFQTATTEDLEVLVRLFWMLRDGNVAPEQQDRILALWEHGIDGQNGHATVSQAFSHFSLLATYITNLGARERRLLESVAPHVDTRYEGYEFVGQLLRLAEQDPATITKILELMITARPPDYDYQDRLRKLLEFLAEHGQKESVIQMCGDRLHHLPGIKSLFDKLTGRN